MSKWSWIHLFFRGQLRYRRGEQALLAKIRLDFQIEITQLAHVIFLEQG